MYSGFIDDFTNAYCMARMACLIVAFAGQQPSDIDVNIWYLDYILLLDIRLINGLYQYVWL